MTVNNPEDIFSAFRVSLNSMGVALIDGTLEVLDREIVKTLLAGLNAPIIFDVGAHRGGFSSLVYEVNPRSTVYAFEPNPGSFKALQTMSIPSEGHFNCYNIAIGQKDGEAKLYHAKGDDGSPLSSLHREVIEDLHGSQSQSNTVELRKLDSLMTELRISTIHLLKLDMEGSELDALKGAETLLRENRVQAIHFEFNDMNVISRTFFKDFWDLLHVNYNIYRLSPSGPIHISHYMPMYCELFAVQTVVAISTAV